MSTKSMTSGAEDMTIPRAEYTRIPGSNRFTKVADARFSFRVAVWLMATFVGSGIVAVVMSFAGLLSTHALTLVLWALLGLYFAFGILIALYRVVSKFE